MNDPVLDELTASVRRAVARIAELELALAQRDAQAAEETPDSGPAAPELGKALEEANFQNTQLSEQLDASRYHEEQLRRENQRLMQTLTETRQRLEKLFLQMENIR